MTYSTPVHQNPNDTFWLARYVHNTLEPLIVSARNYEPDIHLQIALHFDIERSYRHAGSFLDIVAHWGRSGMFLYEMNLTTKEQVDRTAVKVRDFIQTEQAALEAAHDAAAEAATLAELEAADAAADLDYEFELERAQERADIERDEDARDMYEQNVAAGN